MRHFRTRFAFLVPLALAGSVSITNGQTLTPETVAKLRRTIEDKLRTELTTRWYPHAIDREAGGFHQNFARDWTPLPDDNRFLVYQARITWTAAAFAAHSPSHREEFSKYAKQGIVFLDEVMRDKELGGFHFVVDTKGRVDPRLGDEKHVYGIAFVLYAASQVYEVTHDDRAIQVARDVFQWLERYAFDPEYGGYHEAFTRDGKAISQWDPKAPIAKRTDRLGIYYGFKTMNSHIHLLEALAAFHKVEKSPRAKQRLEEILAIVRDRIAIEPGALNLYLTRDWRAAPAHDSFGHDVETAYLLVEAAEVLGLHDDPKTWAVARQLVDHALDWGWDEEFGGFYDKGDIFAGQAYDKTKVWWTQAEGLNALLLMHRKFANQSDRYGRAFLKQWQFIDAHLIDPVHGGWFFETTREGKLIGDGRKANQWKANYHTSRALMNVAKMLEELDKDAPTKPAP
jgi:cellobiose epimerase